MNDDLHESAAAYALDALDDGERAAFEAHLVTCERCAGEVAEFARVAESLAGAVSTPPPPALRSAVLARLDDVAQEPPAAPSGPSVADQSVADLGERRRRRFSAPNLLAAAAVVALIAIGAIVVASDRGGSDFDDVVAADDAIEVVLDGDVGTVEVYYSAELDRVALRGRGLDDLDPGLRYALWAIADGVPIPAGLFQPGDGEIEYVTELTDVSAQAWGVTIEPETGSDAPTGDILLFAEV